MSTKQRAPIKVPEFKTVQEAAEFWDTHSTEDFPDFWEPTDLEFAPDWKSVFEFRVQIEYSLYTQLRARRRSRHVGRGARRRVDRSQAGWSC